MVQPLYDDLVWRGLVHSGTPDLEKEMDGGALTLYYGCDPSADSLHTAHLLGLITMGRLQRAGHTPLALVGGGTGLVGDPSGRATERPLLTVEEVKANVAGIRDQVERFVDLKAGGDVVDNLDWLGSVGLMEFLRDVGKYFSVNQMIAKDSVRTRLEEREQGISFTEFSYQLLQAYDFLQLFDRRDCRLQIGGSDQWGNITAGVDLIRRVRAESAHALVWPLITIGGEKMGKSAGNAVWLDAKRTSPYHLYQFFFRTEDADVGTFLRAYTHLERERIEELDAATESRPEKREAQRVLASEVTTMVHGQAETARAERVSELLFTEEIASLDEQTLLDVLGDAALSTRPRSELDGEGLPLVDALAGPLVKSKAAARTTISQGGAYVNNRREEDVDRKLATSDLIADKYILLRRGKREQHLLRFA
ncbi:MAG TPA: tyrosine--tRNA ligase [Acidimicrobiales bacterium]|nr:tyrosine--tRNA ligase [Acidimicrobiales bacterium]